MFIYLFIYFIVISNTFSNSNKRRNISDPNIPDSDISDSNIPDSNISDFNKSSDKEEIVHLDLLEKISWVWLFF